MFFLEKSPVTSFEGYRVVAFKQGRCNLAERTLTRTVIHFAPQFALVGVFLASALEAVTPELLQMAWARQGCPPAKPATKDVPFLFGAPLNYEALPFVGYDDLWEENGKVMVAFKRAVQPEKLRQQLVAITHQRLLEHAHRLVEELVARGARQPKAIQLKTLRRALGQCSRDGVITLNPDLLMWHADILEETLAHELTHLKHFNHSPAFWRDLTQLLPDWLPRTLIHYLTPYCR